VFTRGKYELLDFGDGRRLERFGSIVLDRPCPAAEAFRRANPDLWTQADARFEGRDQERGQWSDRRELPERWVVAFGSLQFELKRTEFGHLGLFPEQAENWEWIDKQCRSAGVSPAMEDAGGTPALRDNAAGPHPPPLSQRESGDGPGRLWRRERENGLKVLNLFAYTGGSTLAAAAAGEEVVHVDAAKNIAAWARRNAELSGLAAAPIRWIAEDAVKFVKREVKRGNRYDAVILDPPSYGHGPRGEVWRLSKHLPQLLDLCAELTAGRPRFMLLTCHTSGYDAESLGTLVTDAFGNGVHVVAQALTIRGSDTRQLPSGVGVRCEAASANQCETASGSSTPDS
jgi:23S rRNA (cytosine1962-C5)-methyltransferase